MTDNYCLGCGAIKDTPHLSDCKIDNPSLSEKLNAGKLLGIRDKDWKIIHHNNRTREALLITISIMEESHSAAIQGQVKFNNLLMSKLKIALTAKAKANTRADAAEAKLRTIKNMYDLIDK